MHRNPLKVFYRHAPILDLDTLAEVLEISRSQLDRMSRSADRSYRRSPQKKKDGSARITWDANRQLKAAQHLIKERILAQVSYTPKPKTSIAS
jgi:predicted DNA-binding transcriptional regulator AlpA